nr:MAG TPA: hypothetical protein [Caudoviricetes sp.]
MVIRIIGYFQKIVNRIWRYFQNLQKIILEVKI